MLSICTAGKPSRALWLRSDLTSVVFVVILVASEGKDGPFLGLQGGWGRHLVSIVANLPCSCNQAFICES